MMQRIPLTTLAERLDKALGTPVGMKGLNILLYGWKKHRKYGTRYCDAYDQASAKGEWLTAKRKRP